MISLFLGAILIAAIGQPASAVANPSQAINSTVAGTSGTVIVHMGVAAFGQTTVTVARGAKLELVNDGPYYHSISTGSWVNGQPLVQQGANEPTANAKDGKR